MGKSTRLAAWDNAWKLLEGVTAIHSQHPTPSQEQLQACLDKLAHMPLPAPAITEIANAILLAREIEKERMSKC